MKNEGIKILYKRENTIIMTAMFLICANNIFAQEEKPLSYYEIIEERNFFRPKEDTVKVIKPKTEEKKKESTNYKFILTGIVEINGKLKAIIEKNSGEGFYVEEKENVEDYLVEKITQNTVILKKDDEEINLKLKKGRLQQEAKSNNYQEEKKKEKTEEKKEEIRYKPNPMQILRKGNINKLKEEE